MATSRTVSIQSQNLNKSMEIYFQYYLGRFYQLKKKSIENPYLSNNKYLPSLRKTEKSFKWVPIKQIWLHTVLVLPIRPYLKVILQWTVDSSILTHSSLKSHYSYS